jgi:hypothetical protein
VVCSAGKVITEPLEGAGGPNPACAGAERRADDDAEDAQSVGVIVRFGKFRLADLGNLTWNPANALFCPKNLAGPVDVYVATHRAQSMPREMGEYYYGVSSCPPAEVFGLHPRAAILTLGSAGHKQGTPEAIKTILSVPGLDLWQTEFLSAGAEKGYNGPEPFIANMGEHSDKVPYLQVTARADGSFTVTNSRNGFAKTYPTNTHLSK